MKVLVTGGAGFIGSHIVDALRERQHEVIVLDSLDPGVFHHPPPYLRSDVDYCFADLRHWRPDARFQDLEAVVHLAALGGVSRAGKEPENVLTANCGGTARLVEATQSWPSLKRIVLASSFSVYGANYSYRCEACNTTFGAERLRQDLDHGRFEVYCKTCGQPARVVPISEGAPPNPLEIYGASKYMQELCFRGFERAAVQILRFSSVYGKRLRLDDGEATIIAKLAGWIGAGQKPKLFEDGGQIRDWVHVGDVVAAAVALAEGKSAPPVVNVCSGVPTTLLEACRLLQAVLGSDVAPEIVGGYRPGDMRHCLGDPKTLRALIGRDPVPFSKGAALAFGA